MSEPYYPVCESHDPPIIGEYEVGRGSEELKWLRALLAPGLPGAKGWPDNPRIRNYEAFSDAHVGCKIGLVDGNRQPVPLVEPEREDERISAWHKIASHPAFAGHKGRQPTALSSMMARLDELVIAEAQRDAAREAIERGIAGLSFTLEWSGARLP